MNKKILGFVLVGISFLVLYFFAHSYIYSRLTEILGANKFFTSLVIIILAISFPLASILIRKFDGPIFTSFYFFSAVWLGVLFFLLIGFAISDLIIYVFSYISPILVHTLCLIIVSIISVLSVINAKKIIIKHVDISTSLKKNIKIVQISDVHLGPLHSTNYLQKIVDKINNLNPDYVFITGDLFDGSAGISKEMISPLKKIHAKHRYFIPGNHETYIDENEAVGLISKDHITILRNKIKETKDIQIIGVDYPKNQYEKNNPFINNLSEIINKNKFSILLYHPPVGFEKAASAGINLQLSGHTHDGQIFPFNWLVKIFYKRFYGLYSLENSYMYVSQGVGTWGPPMRFLTNSEIVEINLKKKN